MAGLRTTRKVLVSHVIFLLPLLLAGLFVVAMLGSTVGLGTGEITTYRRAHIRMGGNPSGAPAVRPHGVRVMPAQVTPSGDSAPR